MSTTTGIKLDKTTRSRLKILGEQKDRSPHWLIKRAIAQYLNREEHHENEKHEDMQRWQRYQQSGAFIDHADMQDRLTTLAAHAHKKANHSR